MKKTLVALAALAATASFAQSNVTLYGTLDASYGSATNVAKGTINTVHDSAVSSSVWGLRGSEDLGGGLKAIFNVESDVSIQSGSAKTDSTADRSAGSDALFRRAANVGLAGGFGEITLGRRISPSILNSSSTAVLGGNSVGTANHVAQGTAADFFTKNAITYVTPNLGGFTGTIQYGLAAGYDGTTATAATSDAGKYATTAGSLTYGNGPLNAGIGFQNVNNAAGALDHGVTNYRVSYAINALTLAIGAQQVRVGDAAAFQATYGPAQASTSNVYSAGYQVNPNLVVGATLTRNDAVGTQTNMQARYSLSKRTTAYVQAASAAGGDKGGFITTWGANTSGAAANNSASSYNIGIIHNF